ncbi:MAG: outer membrane lipoprotein-sorting protein, partial [Proteobacteria bacterium]|nr:outer membrane lipoprotein-sorting protein [Pseudomonadota bacterium]
KVWVIEQMPKDPYYSWGLHIGYVDQETYGIWYKEVYDKSGKFRTWKCNFRHYNESPSGQNNIGVQYDVSWNIDEVVHHASVSGTIPYSESRLFMPASKIDPDFFTKQNFMQLSK